MASQPTARAPERFSRNKIMKQPAEYTNDAIRLTNASLKRGTRILWDNLNISIQPGEFIAVLGPNGAGKTSLLQVLLGLLQLSDGEVSIFGALPKHGSARIGYIPQQKSFDADIPIRGRDLVKLGANGFSYGFHRLDRHMERGIDDAIETVGATLYANTPLGLLSGGEQQRLRVAQALVGKPDILLCDEPLLSLDVASQQSITRLIDDYRHKQQASVIFVTHEINPLLQYVDRILYFAEGRWAFDKPDNILTSKILSDLYGTSIEVARIKDRVIVVGTDETATIADAHHGSAR
jgi:zinc/manganese transport system ATP-binding protein